MEKQTTSELDSQSKPILLPNPVENSMPSSVEETSEDSFESDITPLPPLDYSEDKKHANWISAYHVLLLIISALVLLGINQKWISPNEELQRVLLSICFGVMGGTLTASRYVIYAIRHRRYDKGRTLWQLLTPLHSALLAAISMIAVRGGLITLSTGTATKEPEYSYFVMAFCFLVGLSSESFVKRLIMAAESLFGERGDLNEETKKERS